MQHARVLNITLDRGKQTPDCEARKGKWEGIEMEKESM